MVQPQVIQNRKMVTLMGKVLSPFWKGIPFEATLKPSLVLSSKGSLSILNIQQHYLEPVLATYHQHYRVLSELVERAYVVFPDLDFVVVRLTQPYMLQLPKALLQPRVLVVASFTELEQNRVFEKKKTLLIHLDIRRDLFERHTNHFSLRFLNPVLNGTHSLRDELMNVARSSIPAEIIFFKGGFEEKSLTSLPTKGTLSVSR
jgi:hypothetical protein